MTEENTLTVNLKDANHLITFGIPAPSEIKKFRNIRCFETDSLEALGQYAIQHIQLGQKPTGVRKSYI